MDQLVETNTINSNVEEADFVACPNGRVKESDVETEESHDEEENMVFWHHAQNMLWQNQMKEKKA